VPELSKPRLSNLGYPIADVPSLKHLGETANSGSKITALLAQLNGEAAAFADAADRARL